MDMDQLEMIVAIANMAGYMEHAERIIIPADGDLRDSTLSIIDGYEVDGESNESFLEFAERRLIEEYATELIAASMD